MYMRMYAMHVCYLLLLAFGVLVLAIEQHTVCPKTTKSI